MQRIDDDYISAVGFFPEALQRHMPVLFRGLYNKGGIQWDEKVKQVPHNGF